MNDYQDFYLQFPDKASSIPILYTTVLEVQDKDGNVIVQSSVTKNYTNISTIGIIYEKQPTPVDPDAPVVPPVPIPGWHVNVRLVGEEDAAALEPYALTLTDPMRVWG